MKKLLFSFILLFTLPIYGQYDYLEILADTIELAQYDGSGVCLLEKFGAGDNNGGGIFIRQDSAYTEGTNAFNYPYDGYQWVRLGWTDLRGSGTVNIAPSGAHTDNVIDFTDVTINYTGSSGPAWLRGGTYGSPVTNADEDQSGMIRFYGETSANGTSYDRGVFVALKTTGTKAIFPIAGLAEILAQTGEGPTKAMAGQFIVGLHTATSKLDSSTGSTDGMFASWLKVYSVSGSVADATSRIAAIWLDNSVGGTVNGEHYSAFITSGGIKPDAVFGLETGAGWDALFYFDETAYDEDPVVSGDHTSGSKDYGLRINLNGTNYLIQLYAE